MVARTVGVEEELLVVDPDSGLPRKQGGHVAKRAGEDHRAGAAGGGVETELMRQQVELGTPPCADLETLAGEIRGRRRAAADIAAAEGVAVAALAGSPLPVTPIPTTKERYLRMMEVYGLTAAEQLSNGCHVHVEVASREEGVAVLDRIRRWLPVLRALSTNSPFWQGEDTGYASYRSQVWGRWPSAGPTEPFGSAAGYEQAVEGLLASGAVLDRGMLYFDARLAENFPTVELRAADVCLEADDSVLLAALARAMVTTAAQDWQRGHPAPQVRVEMLRAAHWRAARWGVGGDLVDPVAGGAVPAREILDDLLAYLRPALEEAGDEARVRDLLDQLLDRGTGADLQRQAYARRHRLSDVVLDAVQRTSR